MNGQTLARILLVVALVAGATLLGVSAYNAGVTAGLAQEGTVVVNPGGYPVGPYVGYGWGHGPGFGFFGFLGFLLVFFLFIGLLRAAFGGRRGWGPGGWSEAGHRHDRWRGGPWEDRARQVHDDWHRQPSRDRAADADDPDPATRT